MSHTLRGLTAALCLAAFAAPSLADVKPDGGDYQAAPPGTKLLVMYYQHQEADKLYSRGQQVTDDFDFKLDVGLLRYVHFTQWGDYIVDPQVILPFGSQRVGLADSRNSGIGDLIFGGTLWTVADFEGGEHLGWSIFITAPTGSDKDEGFALSQNRWAADFQVGYVRRFAPKWSLDAIGEVEFYQDNRKTKVEREPLFQIHTHLRHHLSDATHVALSYRHSWGTKEELHGTTLAGSRNNGNVMLTWATFFAPTWQAQLQYSHDTSVKEGPLLRGLQTRLVKVF